MLSAIVVVVKDPSKVVIAVVDVVLAVDIVENFVGVVAPLVVPVVSSVVISVVTPVVTPGVTLGLTPGVTQYLVQDVQRPVWRHGHGGDGGEQSGGGEDLGLVEALAGLLLEGSSWVKHLELFINVQIILLHQFICKDVPQILGKCLL